MTIPAATHMGLVALTVADLDRSLDYYRTQIGLDVLAQDEGNATLGAADVELLDLAELPGAQPADGYAGLFHFALLLPTRRDLARWLAHAARDRVALTGLSDHDVSEAIYLRDPDGHGIEIYADRPRELWDGEVRQRLTTLPLDVEALFTELSDPATEPFDGLPAGTTMGHVHFRVSDVEDANRFYNGMLGFEVMAQLGAQATFLAAGGYHHHIGANTWESRGRPPAPAGSATLRHATIVLPSQSDLDEVARTAHADDDGMVFDPSGNRLRLVAA